jgi:hypothetical protein
MYMEVRTEPRGRNMFKKVNSDSECMDAFTELGILVTNSIRITTEFNHEIGIANSCYCGLKDMLNLDI